MATRRRYEAKQFPRLKGLSGISDALLASHVELYAGYVKNTNAINDELAKLQSEGRAKGTDAAYAELTRRVGFEENGILLHELYFANLTAEPDPIAECRCQLFHIAPAAAFDGTPDRTIILQQAMVAEERDEILRTHIFAGQRLSVPVVVDDAVRLQFVDQPVERGVLKRTAGVEMGRVRAAVCRPITIKPHLCDVTVLGAQLAHLTVKEANVLDPHGW